MEQAEETMKSLLFAGAAVLHCRDIPARRLTERTLDTLMGKGMACSCRMT